MGKTLVEKIISAHADKDVSAGEIVIAKVDICITQDGTGPLAIKQLQKIGLEKASNPERTILFIDHSAPSSRKELSNDHMALREFAKKTGAILSDVGEGVCHQITAEKYINPGDIIIGADSHTCTGGALGAFATGMGSTDVAIGIALGRTWLRVPETFKIAVTGDFPKGVYAKDLMLHLIGLIGADGATYKSLEFCGPTIDKMPMHDRLTLANMAVEAGAKCGLFSSDEITKDYLEKMGRGDKWVSLEPDNNADYDRVIEIDVTKLEPMISHPHTVDNTKTIKESLGIKVHQVFIGTCTNGRLEDLRIAAQILKNKQRHPATRLIVTPASKQVFLDAVREGLIETFIEAGAAINTPGCGACVGVHQGILGDGENCLATQNRNFEGRMGNVKGNIFLSSPATAAAAAIKGEISDPRDLM
ncbi:MAG: 3-isopropylmalate dehydratase large subunit [Candidatus Margulisiibacteriota bacterium]|nr:MAG: 3-isopropylmalate dehydratase large subunit [Candidatus Margulisiibacteriota bacterium]HCY37452.1 3-isopropylmalate dehydratase large subunit [Candidatus Margulisiibacteriota bacterium]